MAYNLPEIRIKNAWLIRENVSIHLHELWSDDDKELPDHEYYERIVNAYKTAWQPHETTILNGMCEMLDVEFSHNIVDVYIAPWMSAFSDPLIIGVKFDPDEFIDVLTHELLHRLLTANTSTDINSTKSERKLEWQKMFGNDHSFKALVHIPVHACAKAIYLDVLKDKYRLERDIKDCQQWGGYKEAWEYVENNDYKQIVELLRKSYKNPMS